MVIFLIFSEYALKVRKQRIVLNVKRLRVAQVFKRGEGEGKVH